MELLQEQMVIDSEPGMLEKKEKNTNTKRGKTDQNQKGEKVDDWAYLFFFFQGSSGDAGKTHCTRQKKQKQRNCTLGKNFFGRNFLFFSFYFLFERDKKSLFHKTILGIW